MHAHSPQANDTQGRTVSLAFCAGEVVACVPCRDGLWKDYVITFGDLIP